MSENAPDDRAAMSMLPSEYFKRQIYATTWFEKTNLPQLVAAVGEDNIMFETDFPHPTCLYPDPLGAAAENMRDLGATTRDKILGGNAQRLYRL
jgi:predicted TIM-barrel fold metal-dependent hydrolase